VDKAAAARTKVSIIGDLYVRDNEPFNQNLVEHLEACGAEVITTPFSYVVGHTLTPYLHYITG
jgi:ABC-type phosphate/phosphonate transport system permease subunit